MHKDLNKISRSPGIRGGGGDEVQVGSEMYMYSTYTTYSTCTY
jgi:hypothetical protein